jgi:hypothetical protein
MGKTHPTQEVTKKMTKNNNYQDRVIKNVLGLSAEKLNYSKAKGEWDYRGEVIDHGPIKEQIPKPAECQFCGHKIRYGYRLHNTVNQKVVEVGIECLGNFLEITPDLESTLDADKRAAVKQRKNEQLKRRRGLYIAAQGEVGKVAVAVCVGNPCHKDRDFIAPVCNNAATLYTALASGEIDRLAEKYGVTLDQQKIQAFMGEASKVKAADRITMF